MRYSSGMEPTPAETVRLAIDDLLAVVAKAADDLHLFHAAVSRARIAPLPPFPRATVALTSSIIERLKGRTRPSRSLDGSRVTRVSRLLTFNSPRPR